MSYDIQDNNSDGEISKEALKRRVERAEDAVENDKRLRNRIEELEEQVEELTKGMQKALQHADDAIQRCERMAKDIQQEKTSDGEQRDEDTVSPGEFA